jgi:hypothetical protein
MMSFCCGGEKGQNSSTGGLIIKKLQVGLRMKKRIRIILLIICLVLIYCPGTGFFDGIESCDARTSERADQTEALEWGFKFASAIPVKPHIIDRCKSQYQILEVYLERDMPDKMVELATHIVDWRECLSYADLAVYYAQNGHKEKMQNFLQLARECRNRLTDWQTSWQRDRIALRMAEAQVRIGQLETAEKTKIELPTESADLVHTMRLSLIDTPGDYEKSVKKLQSMEKSEYLEIKRDVARAYIMILEQLGPEATAEQCSTLQTRVYEVTDKLPQLLQHEILCSLSRAAFAGEHVEMGRSVLDYAENKLRKRKLNTRYDVKALTTLAKIREQEAKDKQRAESLLQEAKDLLMQSRLKGMDLVAALNALAQGYGIHGNQDAAWGYFHQALQVAEAQKNARPRAMAIAEICTAIGQLGVSLPDDILKEMKHLYEGLGAPW